MQERRLRPPEPPPAHAGALYWYGARTPHLRLSEPVCLCGSALGYQTDGRSPHDVPQARSVGTVRPVSVCYNDVLSSLTLSCLAPTTRLTSPSVPPEEAVKF